MNYIGSKHSLLKFIEDTFIEVTDGDEKVFCDIFAGTGAVGRRFKKRGMQIIANDLQYYSYILNKAYIEINTTPSFTNLEPILPKSPVIISNTIDSILHRVSNLKGFRGFITCNFSPEGDRQYFTVENARKADSIRQSIEKWYETSIINELEYFYLLASFTEAIDKAANTASVYGAFLKKYKASALKPISLKPLKLTNHVSGCKVYNEDANELVRKIECDVLYLDPPYNQRQYGANYHVLETIAKYDNPTLHGKSGLRDYSKSLYCKKREVKDAFDDLINSAKCRHILVSYNNEGLMSLDNIQESLAMRGTPKLFTHKYNRYSADSNREYKYDSTIEHIHYVRVTK